MSDSEDEVEIFTRKIKTLNDVAGNLKNVIESQNNRIKGISPQLNGMFDRLSGMIRRVVKTDKKRFKAWKYYLLTAFFIISLIVLLFVIF